MIVEERVYTCYCGKAQTYVKMYEAEGLAIQRPILGHLLGYFTSELGTLNQVVHLWAYQDLEDRAARRARLLADPAWQAYAAKVQPLVLTQENKILVPAAFSPWAKEPAHLS
ncbi:MULTISPECIES: NIPSNAP family protein [Cupriavidus]|uniref:NIPSNAP family protein n=1 Tax=Cupriavidus sp. 30B13 TaxID=3384241 RepID=UPI003B917F95